jgi:hypothetical protein
MEMAVNLKSVAKRLRHGGFEYALGRFATVRAAYAGMRRVFDPPGEVLSRGEIYSNTIFPDIDIDRVVQAIRDEAVFVGLRLPDRLVNEIHAFARTQPLHANYDPSGPTFFYHEVIRGKCPDGRPVPLGGVHDSIRCPAVKAVTEDEVLKAIVQNYLGHAPRRMMALLNWSFASDFTPEECRRLRFQGDYHFDSEGFDFVYANFYITDTDRFSGAHVMMKRSHNKKPLRMLLGSAATTEAAVWRQFGRENEIVIEGKAGTGFVQDTSCYHRASAPSKADRLMLAIRYVN